MKNPRQYVGDELALFAEAHHWKRYVASVAMPYITGNVLEVGAGIGGTTRALLRKGLSRWIALEPDCSLLSQCPREINGQPIERVCGTTGSIQGTSRFDTIIYADVLEHIPDDADEIRRAAGLLRKNGHIILIGPALEFLWSPFDKAVGHFRRYNRRHIHRLEIPSLKRERLRFMDSAGMIASLGNRFLLRHSVPSRRSVLFWDQFFVPVSRVLDPLFFYLLGKSILVIWRKQ